MSEPVRLRRPRVGSDAAHPAAAPAAPSRAHATPAAAPPAWAPSPSLTLGAVQRKPVIGAPDDAFEQEADVVATRVASGQSAPGRSVSRVGATAQRSSAEDEDVQRLDEEEVQRAADAAATPAMQDAAAGAIRSPGAGSSLPPATRGTLESRMGVDLSGVRVHTGPDAEHASAQLHARAFTHGADVWLGSGESASDVPLMAHEVTHVLQQDAVVRRRPATLHTPSEASPAPSHAAVQRTPAAVPGIVQRLVPDWVLEQLADYARYIPGWTLFTVIIGFNPLTRAAVPRTATSLLEGFMGLVPFGTFIFDALREHGIIQDAFAWVEGELARLDLSLGRIERTIDAAWEDVSLSEGFDYNLDVVRRHFGALYNDVEAFALSLVSKVVDMIKDAALDVAERLLAENRAWSLIKKILGRDPLRDEPVEATPVEILEDFLLLIGQDQHLAQMRERGTVEETANWLATQIGTFMGLLGELRGLIGRAWDAIQPQNLPNLLSSMQTLAADAGAFLQRVWDFATTVAAEVLRLIKDALLGWLSTFANDVPGFHLLTVILGRNPFTGDPVARTAENIIRGFITLLPGGAAIYAQLAETGTVAAAAARIEAAMGELGISWEFIVGLFTGIWNSLTIESLLNPIDTFVDIVGRFGEPILRLFQFVGVVLQEMFFLILQMMNFPSDLIGSIVSNAMQAIDDVKRDPVGFLMNMLAAVRAGFSSFFDNIVTHLIGGLADWMFRGLRGAGIEPPTDLSFASVLDFVLQILGISMDRIWEKLADRIGQENVDRIRGAIDRLVGIWTFVRDVQQRGVAAIWEYIEGQISGLWNMVLDKAREWVMERIIARAIQWLLSLLDPTGIMPVINSFIAFFNAVQSAIEYLRDMLAIVNDYVATIAAVARGEIQPGAEKLERGLANAIPVAIGFLANQFGLGNIGEKIQEIVAGIRGVVDSALDWLVDRAVGTAQSMLSALGFGGAEEEAQDGAVAAETEEPAPQVDAIPEGLPPEEVKRLVLDTVNTRLTGPDYTSIRSIHTLLRAVMDANRDRGLHSLSIRVEDAESMSVLVEAAASAPEGRRIPWADIFAPTELHPAEEVEQMRASLSEASQSSFAAVSVDTVPIGSLSESGAGLHAEEALVRGPSWIAAIEAARQAAVHAGASRVVLAINRTPCASCVSWLVSAIADAKQALGDQSGKVVFVLAATGTYRRQARLNQEDTAALVAGSQRMAQRLGRPFDEVYQQQEAIWLEDLRSFSTEWVDDDGEEYSGLGDLASAGWQIAGLDAGQPMTPRQLELSTAAARLAEQFGWDS